jgi:hypothetical protein
VITPAGPDPLFKGRPQPDPVMFIEAPEVKPVTSGSLQIKEAEAVAATVKVRVQKPFRIVHEGKPYTEGDIATVPEHLAAEWEQAGSVKRVQAKKEK